MIVKWLKDERYAPGSELDAVEPEVSAFLPVEIEAVVSSTGMSQDGVLASVATGPNSAHRVDITLSDGRRILVEGATDLPAVLALVEGLML